MTATREPNLKILLDALNEDGSEFQTRTEDRNVKLKKQIVLNIISQLNCRNNRGNRLVHF